MVPSAHLDFKDSKDPKELEVDPPVLQDPKVQQEAEVEESEMVTPDLPGPRVSKEFRAPLQQSAIRDSLDLKVVLELREPKD